ncbi:MAG: hypothetical protein BroJett040_00450 [Oligoflexia bacterium]|nr:MAG: hypothetical protein BroJett040_00450 [Oligoflexia bacterium]
MSLKLNLSKELCAIVFLFLLGGCAHQASVRTAENSQTQGPHELPSYRVSDPEPPQVVDQELDSIPTEMNPRVEQWIRYFQGRGRPHMERYLARSTRYSGVMKRILKQNGLPEDLIYIALIESGFSSRATSRAAAVGYWQFIKPTGRRYGLEINSFVDERRDPVLSTQAAAEYFKSLYSIFGSWYLAMASYNVGENRVKREVMNHYTRDFWELARKRRFPKETINYIPKYIAAKIIGKKPEAYGFTNVDYEQPIEFELIKVDKPVNLRQMAERMGYDYDDLKQLNPKFRGEVAPTRSQTGQLELRVPVGQAQQALAAAQQSFVDKVEFVADAGETETYRVRSGDSLYTIARKYRTTVAWLRDVNDFKPGKKLRIGMRIQVPDRSSSFKTKPVVIAKKPKIEKTKDDSEQASTNPEVVTTKGVFYMVQPGDTLSAIADDYDSTVNELRKMNKLGRGSVLKAGMKLRVPKDDGLPSDPGRVAQSSKSSREDLEDIVQSEPGSQGIAHVVRAGENLSNIAKKYGVTVQSLRKANNMGRKSMLKVGSSLTIPVSQRPNSVDSGGTRLPASTKGAQINLKKTKKQTHVSKVKVHVVRRGDNLLSIANRYNVTVESIKEKNNLEGGSKILIGARILIPSAIARD